MFSSIAISNDSFACERAMDFFYVNSDFGRVPNASCCLELPLTDSSGFT